MDAVRASSICCGSSSAVATHSENADALAVAAPSDAPWTSSLEREIAALKQENESLKTQLEEAHKRAGTIAECQRRQGEIHNTLLRVAHDEAVQARDAARADAQAARDELVKANDANKRLQAASERQQASFHAEAGLLAADAKAARDELVGRKYENATSAAGVHLAALRSELSSCDETLAKALKELAPKAAWRYAAPRPTPMPAAPIVGGASRLQEQLRQWSEGETQEVSPPTPPAKPAASSSAGGLSPGGLARLTRLETIAEAAAVRFEALQAEHDALLRSYEELAGRGWRPEESLGGVVNSEGVVTEVVLRRRSPDNAV